MARADEIIRNRKLSQQIAYTTIQLHEGIGRKAGMSGTDHKYLGFLLQHGALSAGDFSVITGLTTGAVTSLIDRLEKKKLVKRMPDKKDRRKVIIVPNTQKITQLLMPLYRDFQHNTDQLMETFSSAHLKVLEGFFLKYLELMQTTIEGLHEK